MGYCPNCGTEFNDHDEYCRECGANLTDITTDDTKQNESDAPSSRMVYCRECGATISETAESCPECGAKQQPRQTSTTSFDTGSMDPRDNNPGLAAAASFVIPGLGQVYNGQIGKGIVMGAITFAFALTGIGLIIALPVWIYLVYDAYKVASGEERPWPTSEHPNTTPVGDEPRYDEEAPTTEFEPAPIPVREPEPDPTRFRLDAPHVVGAIIIVFGVIATIRTPVGIPVLLVGIAITPATRNWVKGVFSRSGDDDGAEDEQESESVEEDVVEEQPVEEDQ